MKKSLISLIVAVFLLQSCAKVFYAPDARYVASAHKTIAIVPPKVSIAARKKVDAAALIEPVSYTHLTLPTNREV